MPAPHLIASAYAQLYLRNSRQPAAVLLQGTGLQESELSERQYISAVELAVMMRNLDATGAEPGWAARIGSQLNVSAHGPLGFAALSAPTLGLALQVMAEFYPVRINCLSTELQQVGNRLRFSMQDLTGDTQFARWVYESTLKVLEALVETIMGHTAGEQVLISFSLPTPDYAPVLAQIYGASCAYGASHTAISIPASWQHIPSPLYDESTYRSNIAKCREIIGEQGSNRDPVQRVRNILSSHFDYARSGELEAAPPSLEIIASQLHLTPRTLMRHLKLGGSSYRQLLDQTRMHCAEQLLQQASLTVAEVAAIVGYSDPANFGRAFRNLKGVTPAGWRRGE